VKEKKGSVTERERKGGGHLRTFVILHFENVVWYCCILLYRVA
jgi:hypothetical protein